MGKMPGLGLVSESEVVILTSAATSTLANPTSATPCPPTLLLPYPFRASCRYPRYPYPGTPLPLPCLLAQGAIMQGGV